MRIPRFIAALLITLPLCTPASAALSKAGDTVEGRISSANAAIHEIQLTAGQFFHAQVNGIRMSVELTDATGRALGPAGRTAAAIVQESGTHRLKVRTSAPTVQRYLLTVNTWRPSRPDDTARMEAIGVLTEGYREAERATSQSRAKAIELYRSAREKAASIADTWLEARCLLAESLVHSALGATDAALLSLSDAMRVYRARGDRGGEVYAMNQAALLHAYRSEFTTAFDYYHQAIAHWKEKGDQAREREVRRNLAIAHAMAGNLQTAIETYQLVLTGFRESGDRYNEAVTLVQISDFYLNLGDYEQAIRYATQALPMHRAHLDKTAEVHTLTNLGESVAGQGKHAEALAHFNKAMEVGSAAGLGWLHVNTQALAGASEEALGRISRAESHFQEALAPMRAHGNRDGSSRLLTRLGLLALRQGRLEEAAENLKDAANLAEGLPDGVAKAYSQTALARLARKQGKAIEAREQALAALEIIEHSRIRVDDKTLRATFLASRAASYDLAIDLLLENKDTAGAFAVLQRFRARSLADMLAKNNQQAEAPTPASPHDMRPDTALLSYHFGEERSWLFILTREGIAARPMSRAGVLEADVRLLRDLLAQPSRATLGRYVQTAFDLFRACIGPALPSLTGKKRLAIVADGPLHYLPFEALLTETPKQLAYHSLPYLLERWNVSYAPSATAFATLQRRADAASKGLDLVAYGDPAGDLPAAADELRTISSVFPSGRALVFPGAQASKQAVMQSAHLAGARRIHFATHGVLGEGSSATSGLLLANNALLSASEILRQRWNADLVVLSACRTGLGPKLRGEGILGFTRAFHFAGVASVAVSLWPVSDESTAALMGEFYQRLSRGEGKSEALRQAKLSLLRSGPFAHPYYWAPFVLSGKI